MGGALAEPVKNYPQFFAAGGLFDKYPFLLANLICVAILVCGITIGVLFLEETHEDVKYGKDRGLELGQWFVNHLGLGRGSSKPAFPLSEKSLQCEDEVDSLLDYGDDLPPGYRTTEGSPRSSASLSPAALKPTPKSKRAAPRAFTRQVIMIIVGYGILAL